MVNSAVTVPFGKHFSCLRCSMTDVWALLLELKVPGYVGGRMFEAWDTWVELSTALLCIGGDPNGPRFGIMGGTAGVDRDLLPEARMVCKGDTRVCVRKGRGGGMGHTSNSSAHLFT